jgi:hypothetical protein
MKGRAELCLRPRSRYCDQADFLYLEMHGATNTIELRATVTSDDRFIALRTIEPSDLAPSGFQYLIQNTNNRV